METVSVDEKTPADVDRQPPAEPSHADEETLIELDDETLTEDNVNSPLAESGQEGGAQNAQIQANKPDVVLLDHQTKAMFVIEFSAPAETNIVLKEEEKRTKYRDLLFELRRLYPDHSVGLVILIIGSLGGTRHTLLLEIQKIPACRDKAHILADFGIQKYICSYQHVMDEDTKSLLKSIYQQNNQIIEDIKTIKNDLQKVTKTVHDIEVKLELLESENKELKVEVETAKRKLKNNNLVIFGIEEKDDAETTNIVKQTLQDKLNIRLEDTDINNTYRIGKRNTSAKRPIILELVRNIKKQEILRNCGKLKGTDIAVSHDLTTKEREEKKVLYKYYKEAKGNKCETTLLKNKLIINGVSYKYEDLTKEVDRTLNNIETSGNSADLSSKRKNVLSPQEGMPKRFTRSVSRETKNMD
ncbi:unnamed protein product [Phaedon cochleariae]|uniref:Uncharacterized protein n=1 Tax=Phaedon cochleariae TaxID=80249 RepID=A0A9P0DP94_PHACE|nr:unnamed protein product [Phaedon cochleariae]